MLTGINEYGRLRRVAMRRPADAMIDQKTIDREWRDLNYHTAPDFKRAVAEHAAFADILARNGADIVFLPPDDALFVAEFDPLLDTSGGAPAGRRLPHAITAEMLDLPFGLHAAEVSAMLLLERMTGVRVSAEWLLHPQPAALLPPLR